MAARRCRRGDIPPPAVPTPDRLADRLRPLAATRLVIVCIGNELAGDDAAGVQVARRLAGKLPWPLFDCRSAPENFLGKIVEACPQTVLLVDAVHLDAPPGTVRLLKPHQLAGQGPSTHGPAPEAFLELLQQRCGCRCVLAGIQPQSTAVGSGLSPVVGRAVEALVNALVLVAAEAAGEEGDSARS